MDELNFTIAKITHEMRNPLTLIQQLSAVDSERRTPRFMISNSGIRPCRMWII